MIGADSQAAIQAIRHIRGKSGHYLMDIALNLLEAVHSRHSGIKLTLAWMLGHTGIEGNEHADEEAKKVALSESSPQ